MRKIVQDKRAGYTDIFIFMIVAVCIVFISGVFIYMGATVEDKLHESLDNRTSDSQYVNYTETIDENFGAINKAYASLYWISVFLIFGMIVAIFIGSYMVQTKPVFFVPYIFIMIIAIVVSAGLSNAYEDVTANATLSATFDGFLGANFLLLNLPVIVTIIGFAGGVIMFIRMQKGAEQYVQYG